MTENKQTNPDDIRLKVSDYLTNSPDHLRNSDEFSYLLGASPREIRAMVRNERMEGIPIIGTERGYRLASSLEEYRTYTSKRIKHIDQERKDIALSDIAVTTKGYFKQQSGNGGTV